MGWKECLTGQQLNGRSIAMNDAAFEVRIWINRQQFGSVRVKFRDAAGLEILLGPLDSGSNPNPLSFPFQPGGGVKGGQCGWIVELARTNDADPYPDIDVEIVQGPANPLDHSYVCPTDKIPGTGIELRDYVKFM